MANENQSGAKSQSSTEPFADGADKVVEHSAELTSDQEMELVRTQLAEARDKMFRAQAELENYRKRARRELDDERRYAEIHLLRELLPVLDNIHRAITAAGKNADPNALLEGIRMVRQQLETLLERHHCKPIDAVGQPFDPARHEAVMQQTSADQPESTVTDVVQTGFQLHDRVVRPAQVVVSKKE